jgi:hypothetical protein
VVEKKFRCEHDILRDRPCPKCGRSEEDCLNYERPVLMFLKETLIKSGVSTPEEAWMSAKSLRAAIAIRRKLERKLPPFYQRNSATFLVPIVS